MDATDEARAYKRLTKGDLDDFVAMTSPFVGQLAGHDALEAMIELLIESAEKGGQKEKPFISRPIGKKASFEVKHVYNTDEVIEAVKKAKAEKKVLRVAGSEHSPPDSIFAEEEGTTLLLDGELRNFEVIEKKMEGGKERLYCRIGGGCYLGHNPKDSQSTVENSASFLVDKEGFAFPILGGMSHQSVGGFMMTSSAGGSLQHGFADVIREIEFVNGKGELKTASPDTDLWHAAGVSMGLFGVITRVTFRLDKTYLVKGIEETQRFDDSYLGADKNGISRLKEAIETTEYFHVAWFPQKYVDRVLQWTGTHAQNEPIVPYHHPLQNPLAAAGAVLALKICNEILQKGHLTPLGEMLIGLCLKPFVPLDKPQNFCDVWYKTLPNDNQAPIETTMRVDFTEIWLPTDQTQTLMTILQNLFKDQMKCGNFATELYAAKKSPFWLSMSYDRDVVRVDPYWWHWNEGNRREFFEPFWEALLGLPGARLHWGKYLPLPGQKVGSITFNLDHLKKSYPMLDQWLKLREEMDPDQVFLSKYWREIFEIPKCQ